MHGAVGGAKYNYIRQRGLIDAERHPPLLLLGPTLFLRGHAKCNGGYVDGWMIHDVDIF